MRVIIQRVTKASVSINGFNHCQIKNGFLIFLGITHEDTLQDIEWLVYKILNLRVFKDENAKMNRSIKEDNGSILVVSQFTLYASTVKGNRPNFLRSAKAELAKTFYEKFIETLINEGIVVKSGVFGADMQVNLVNDGPVTIIMDTKNKE
jgi:D-tyrosyl-tRNA(Tyr) deacylase